MTALLPLFYLFLFFFEETQLIRTKVKTEFSPHYFSSTFQYIQTVNNQQPHSSSQKTQLNSHHKSPNLTEV